MAVPVETKNLLAAAGERACKPVAAVDPMYTTPPAVIDEVCVPPFAIGNTPVTSPEARST